MTSRAGVRVIWMTAATLVLVASSCGRGDAPVAAGTTQVASRGTVPPPTTVVVDGCALANFIVAASSPGSMFHPGALPPLIHQVASVELSAFALPVARSGGNDVWEGSPP